MHILFVTKSNYTSSFQPGRRMELPKALKAMGHQVDLFSASYAWRQPVVDKLSYQNVKIIPIGNIPFIMSLIYATLLFSRFVWIVLITNERPDFVIVDYAGVLPLLPFALLARLRLISLHIVLDVRSPPVEAVGLGGWLKVVEYQTAIWLAQMFFDGITVITQTLRDEIIRKHKITPDRIGIWTSGASLDAFNPKRVKRPLDLDQLNGKFIVMHHGVLSQNRGLQQAIEAIELLKSEYPDIVLLIVGKGAAEGELQAMVDARGLDDHVFIHDAVPYENMPDYISVADVGLIPLPNIAWWRFSSPQKLMEYLAMEKPVIVSDIPAHRDVLGNSECVIYLPSIEPLAIAGAIEAYYQRRRELPLIGKSGRKIIERNCTWEAQAGKLAVYLQAIGPGS